MKNFNHTSEAAFNGSNQDVHSSHTLIPASEAWRYGPEERNMMREAGLCFQGYLTSISLSLRDCISNAASNTGILCEERQKDSQESSSSAPPSAVIRDYLGNSITPNRANDLRFARVIHPDGTLTDGLGVPRKRFFS